MTGLKTEVRYIKGVGEARAKSLLKLGIKTLYDLVSFFPRAYEDRTEIKVISQLMPEETACVRTMVASAPRLSHVRRGLDIVKVRAVDDSGAMDITFFNQSYIKDALIPGESYVFFGKNIGTPRKPQMTNPVFEKAAAKGTKTRTIVPIYSLTQGISQNLLTNMVRQGLDICGDVLPDALPEEVRARMELCSARYAYENIHFPNDFESLEIARRRLIFEELFVLAAAMKRMRRGREQGGGRILKKPELHEMYALFPFELTGAQKRAISEAAEDMSGGALMNRLVQGDVGSGKTAVAAALCWMTWQSGCQSAFMVPTEILAEQHYNTFSALLEPLGMHVAILKGGMTAKQKRDVTSGLKLGEIDVVIGTHALISEGVEFFDLALVIADEQHRFGVNQRLLLTAKGDRPHVLVMSATPIPRTLALMIYGDLDVSVIDELPPGRQEIDTFTVTERHRQRVYSFIRQHVSEGRQVYIVCPMVEESEIVGESVKAAEEHANHLKTDIFPDLRVALLHGKMKPKEKDAAMSAFVQGETDILVATTVIEVGVDVPNAALMVIENADRFGLSQLHQLRGRVGRGEHKSYCVLFAGSDGAVARERLKAMTETNDGFKIAEEDLQIRGPGDFFGSRQHGLPEMRIASIASDMNILAQAQSEAEAVLAVDPEFSLPENARLRARIDDLFDLNAGTLN